MILRRRERRILWAMQGEAFDYMRDNPEADDEEIEDHLSSRYEDLGIDPALLSLLITLVIRLVMAIRNK